MTEAEWLAASSPYVLVNHRLTCGASHFRRRRLFAVAIARRMLRFLPDDRFLKALVASETYADDPSGYESVKSSRAAVVAARKVLDQRSRGTSECYAAYVVERATQKSIILPSVLYWTLHAIVPNETAGRVRDRARASDAERASQVRLVHCVFANPFRPVAFDPAWLTSTVTALAAGIYADQAFDRLPILADALEEAGCDNADVLAHCRGLGPHARGCWVVDGALGKT